MSRIIAAAQRAGRTGRGLLPTGQLLTPEVGARRYKRFLWLLWAHVRAPGALPAGPGRRRPRSG